MEKRKFEKLQAETSLLGFGCMRFPLTAEGKIDEAEAEKMLDLAIASGVNYIDTAYPYHNGDSEPFVGRVLDKYDRSSYYLATKLPVWKVETTEDAKQIFEEQLERLHKEYVDFYLLHALNKERWETVKRLKLLPYLEEMKREGKIRYIGFSFHDEYEVFEEILNAYDWDFCQIQFNYMDTEEQAGLKGYELAQKKGIPMVIMEPVKGGMLAALPDEIAANLKAVRPNDSIPAWALRFVGTYPNVKVILSGMSDMQQVKDNLKTFMNFEPLNEQEKVLIAETAEALRARVQNGCTACRYCMPCPAGVDIPRNFRIWNEYHVYQNKERARKSYFQDFEESAWAKNCVRCGKCETVCPQHLSIRKDLARVTADMETLR
ncbi:MAG: aldo/keto reductase [bacterium]|nr:aldo/keto reductase [bacterium]